MKFLPVLVVVYTLISCSNRSRLAEEQSRNPRKNPSYQEFQSLDFFEKNKSRFQADTFAITGKSKAGGELIIYHSPQMPLVIFDFWMYGEMGKMHAVFFTDQQQHIKLVKRTQYEYDKPFTEPEYTITEQTDYIVFKNEQATIYNATRKKKDIDPYQTSQTGNSIKELFKELTEGINLTKYKYTK
jgi:hypothetical protein